MKKTWILLLMAGLFACSRPASDMVEIKGIVNNPTDTDVEVLYYKDFLMNESESVTVSLGRRNSFTARLTVQTGQFIYVRLPGRTISLYALPGASVHVEFDAEDPEIQPVVKGKLSYESQFMTSYVQNIERNYGRGLVINKMTGMDAHTFVNFMDSIHAVKMDYLNHYEDFSALDEDFVRIMRTNIDYDRYSLLLEYPMYKAYYGTQEEPVDLGEGYYAFLDVAALFEDSRIDSRSYVNFLSTYLNYMMEEYPYAGDEEMTYFQMQFDVGKNHFDGLSRDYVLSQAVISALNFDGFETAQELYDAYLEEVSEGEYMTMVVNEYQAILALTPGNPAPDFTMTDIHGDTVSMRDFRGKVVYLDFWASWCGPCMREMPHAKELKRKLATQHDLVFLYISIDTDEEAWRKTVAEQDIQGVHLNVPGTKVGAPSLYNVKGVPTFFIIGRDGKIYDNRPPRPSNPAILPSLMSALLD